jgi:hypothetical protein
LFIGKRNSVNGIIRLLGSDMVWPKVIPLSGAYCNYNFQMVKNATALKNFKLKKIMYLFTGTWILTLSKFETTQNRGNDH